MEISELVIQGLRGFNGVVRLSLGAKITVLVPAEKAQGAAILDVLQDLLSPRGAEPSLEHLVDPTTSASRIGMTLIGRADDSFRILRDLQSGKTSLLKKQGEQMVLVTESVAEISQMVTSQIGFPQVDVLRTLFWTKRQDLPSQRSDLVAEKAETTQTGKVQIGSGSGPHEPAPLKKKSLNAALPPGFSGEGAPADEFGHLSDDEKKSKLAELRAQLAQKDSVQELEFELDGLQKKGFELEEKLRPLENLRFQLHAAKERAAACGNVKDVPADFRQTVEKHLQRKNQYVSSQAELERQIEKLREKFALIAPKEKGVAAVMTEALEEPLLKFGLLAGVGCSVLGVMGAFAFPPLRNVAYANIVGFFVALVGGFKAVAEFEHVGRSRGQAMRLQKDFDKAKSRFELDESSFSAMLNRFGLKSNDLSGLDEVLSRAEEAREAQTQTKEAEAALAEAEAEVPADVQAEQKGIQNRVKELEEKLYAAGGFMGDPNEMRSQIANLEAALAGAEPETSAAEEAAFDFMSMDGPELSSASEAVAEAAAEFSGETQTYDEVTRQLLDAGSDIFFTDVEAVAKMVEARLGQMLGGLTDKRYTGVVFHAQGRIGLVEAMSGQEVGFKDLPPGDKDLLYLALKLSIIESYVRKSRMPVFFDGVFDGFPDARDTLHGRILQFLGSLTQVVCITNKPGLMAISPQRLQL